MNKPLIIIGDGGHASVLVEILNSQNRVIVGYTAPMANANFFGLDYLGTDESIKKFDSSEVELVLGLGSVSMPEVREKLYKDFKDQDYSFASVIHSSALVSPSAILGEGCQVMAGAIVQTNSIVEENVIINTGSQVDHDCKISMHTHIAPGVTLSGGVEIGTCSHIGTAATVIQRIHIGNRATVGAGAVVVNAVDDNKTVVGVPAKEV